MSNLSPAEQHQQLVGQQSSLLATKAILSEQLAETDKNLAAVRAALEGVMLGYKIADQEAKAKADPVAPEAAANPETATI